jgi:SAM-dependent methyltransferase
MTRPRLTLKEAIDAVLEPAGKTIIDVGCGDGAIVRHLAGLGAVAIGIEVSEGQLERARKQAGEREVYRVAGGESLPFADDSAGAILFMKSFHHIPLQSMPAALEEAARVLEPGGQLVVIEPLAEGNYFDAMRPLEDETAVRAAAYAVLKSPPANLLPDDEFFYDTVIRFRDASHFIEAVTAPDPARRERLPEVEAELRRRYEAYAQYDADGAFFVALMRRNTFCKAGRDQPS